MTNPTPQTPPDSIEKIADEMLDLISRCPDELTASVVLENIRRKAYTLRALPTSQRIAGEQFTNSERGMLRNVANTLMRRAQKKGQTHQLADVLIGLSNTVPRLPSAELERDALHAAYYAGWKKAASWTNRDDLIYDEGSMAYEKDRDAALAEIARANEAKRSDAESWRTAGARIAETCPEGRFKDKP